MAPQRTGNLYTQRLPSDLSEQLWQKLRVSRRLVTSWDGGLGTKGIAAESASRSLESRRAHARPRGRNAHSRSELASAPECVASYWPIGWGVSLSWRRRLGALAAGYARWDSDKCAACLPATVSVSALSALRDAHERCREFVLPISRGPVWRPWPQAAHAWRAPPWSSAAERPSPTTHRTSEQCDATPTGEDNSTLNTHQTHHIGIQPRRIGQ